MKLLLSAIVLALLTTLSLSAGPAMAASPTTNLSPEGMTPPPPPPPPAETVGSAPVAISEQQPPATGPDDGLLSALASGENTENLSAEQRAQTLQQYLLGTVTDVGFSPTEEEVLAALEELLPGPDAGPITTTAYAVSAELLVERAVLLLPAAAANIVTRVVQSYPERAAAIVTAAVTAAPDQTAAIVTAAIIAAPDQTAAIVTAAVIAAPDQTAAIVTAAVTAAPDQKAAIVDAAKLAAPDQEVAITTAAEAALPDPETAPAIAVPQQPPVININPMVTEYPGTTARDDGPGVTPGPPPGPPVPPEPTSPFVP